MEFKVGDRVKYSEQWLPIWGAGMWIIVDLTPGGNGTKFADLLNDNGAIRELVPTSSLEPAD